MDDFFEKALMTIEDEFDNPVPLKRFRFCTYLSGSEKATADTLEEAEKFAMDYMEKNPWSNGEVYLIEIRKVYKSVPEHGVAIRSVDVQEYQKQLENKQDGI